MSTRMRRAVAAGKNFLADQTRAGLLLLAAALIAIAWANSPWRNTYRAIADTQIGPNALGLHMTVEHFAADGLLAIFFFVVGLELKGEFVTGSLRDPRRAALPMICAVLGMAVPALIYAAIQYATGSPFGAGWAIPAATDIAFAVALLGIFGTGLPPGVRVFLLTLAVVDDLLAIVVIAVFYSHGLDVAMLAGAAAAIAVFAVLVQRRVTAWYVLVPLAVLAWALMYRSGVHATVAGVALGMSVPARARAGRGEALTHRFAAALQPLSAGVALPVFAFFAAGVSVTGGIAAVLTHPAALGVMAGLVVGKFVGIYGGLQVLTRCTPLTLGGGVDLADLRGVAFLAGIGFTVSLLIAELSFPGAAAAADAAKVGVLAASLTAGIIGAAVLSRRRAQAVRGRPSRR